MHAADIRAPITVEEARRVVEYIRSVAGDDEVAHALEDALRAVVLQTIADTVTLAKTDRHDVAELARVALSTSELDFSRWCA